MNGIPPTSNALTNSPRNASFPPVLLSRREAAAYLSISPRTLWSLTAAGKLRSVTIGTRMVRYTVADLDAFVASCRGGRR